MFALYSTVLLIDTRNNLSNRYHTYVTDVLEFQKAFFTFELTYDSFLTENPNNTIAEVKTNFKSLNDQFAQLQKNFYKYAGEDKNDDTGYEHYLYLIQQNMNDILSNLMKYENILGTQEEDLYKHNVHENIKAMFSSVVGLQNEVLTNFEHSFFSDKIENQERWLYWSVIFIGLSGFILVLLNADKIRSMRELNKERVKTLALLEERLAALESAHDGIIIINSKGKVSYLNRAVCNILGIKVDERESYYKTGWPRVFVPQDFEFISKSVYPLFDKGHSHWMGDFCVHSRTGQKIETELSVTRSLDGGFIGTFQDISEKRKSELEKKELEEQFYQAQKMEAVGRLAGGIAHDFNNILAAMNGYSEFLLDDLDEGTDQHEFARNILQAGLQARDLVDQMLAFSRRGDSVHEVIDISSSVQEVISMLRATLPKSVEIKESIEEEHNFINGNLTQISQLIMNLCVNAVDAMDDERGELEIHVGKVESSEFFKIKGVMSEGFADLSLAPFQRIDDMSPLECRLISGQFVQGVDYVCLRVRDTGSGMSRVIMERVFEPFFTTKSVDKGTGLGLSTVHGVVLSHRGVIVVESTVGEGTCFNLFFPLAGTETRNIDLSKETISVQKSGINRRLLLVEDQEGIRLLTYKMLRRIGYEVSMAKSGLEGLDMVRDNPTSYDLVLADHNMPKMTGLEMVQQVYFDMPDIPFIILSGYSEDRIRALIKDHPAVKHVLRKPIARKDLETAIESVFQQSGLSDQPNKNVSV